MLHVKEVRGKGLLLGVKFDCDIDLDVKHKCFDRKLLITAIGKNVIRMVPPLILNEKDCDKAFEIIKAAVEIIVK